MAQFQAFEKGVQVMGRAVLAFVDGMQCSQNRALQVLSKNGIINVDPNKWYCQQSFLNAFKTIAEEIGPYALYCIGTKIPQNAQFPPDIDSLDKALESIDIAYHMNHRGGQIGSYNFYKSEEGLLLFRCENPYPCEFDRGIIEGMARKFTPKEHFLAVKHDDEAPCRDKGDQSCTYSIIYSKP